MVLAPAPTLSGEAFAFWTATHCIREMGAVSMPVSKGAEVLDCFGRRGTPHGLDCKALHSAEPEPGGVTHRAVCQ